jgi:hypothetical protein
LIGQTSIDVWSDSTKEFVNNLKNLKTSQVQVDGFERVFGRIFDDNFSQEEGITHPGHRKEFSSRLGVFRDALTDEI